MQPRIRLGRSFDQRSHTYLGYALRVRGNIGSEVREFLVGVGEGAHAKHQFQVGDTVSGEALPVNVSRPYVLPVSCSGSISSSLRLPQHLLLAVNCVDLVRASARAVVLIHDHRRRPAG